MNLLTDQKPNTVLQNWLPFIIYAAICIIGIIGLITFKDNSFVSNDNEPIHGEFRGYEY